MTDFSNRSISRIAHRLNSLLHDESGQDLIEYALAACLVGLGSIASVKNYGGKVSSILSSIGTAVTTDV